MARRDVRHLVKNHLGRATKVPLLRRLFLVVSALRLQPCYAEEGAQNDAQDAPDDGPRTQSANQTGGRAAHQALGVDPWGCAVQKIAVSTWVKKRKSLWRELKCRR